MKRISTKVIAIYCSISVWNCASAYELNQLNEKVKAITGAGLHNFESPVGERKLLESIEFSALKSECSSNWNDILLKFNEIAGGAPEKRLVVWGMSDLSAGNYMLFLEGMTQKYVNNKIEEEILKIVLFPRGKHRAFVIDNYQHARVAAVMVAIRTKTQTNDLIARIDEITSGEEKTLLDEYREAHEGLPEGKIPKVILPP